MKIALLQPRTDERYESLELGYGSGDIPETSLAVLASALEWSKIWHYDINCLDPNRTNEGVAKIVSQENYNILGVSDRYSNHRTCTDILKLAKEQTPNLTTVIGGPNATLVARQTMKNHPYIDFLVAGDGVEALIGITEEKSPEEIPNILYRKHGEIRYSKIQGQRTNLDDLPSWDYNKFENRWERLEGYFNALAQPHFDPWKTPPLAIFSSTGCTKAMRRGPCKFCYEDRTGSIQSPELFWHQLNLFNFFWLDSRPLSFYVADDIFTISPTRIRDLARTKPGHIKVNLRAYSYLPDLAKLGQKTLEEMAKDLEHIGIFNLFFGSEHFNTTLLEKMNKEGVNIKEAKRVMKTLYEYGGIKTTMAYLLGFSGETKESLRENLKSLEHFADLGKILERVYYSKALPFMGTQWGEELLENKEITKEYKQLTGENLIDSDYPDYQLLSDLAIKFTTDVSAEEINDVIKQMREISGNRPQGGFLLEST